MEAQAFYIQVASIGLLWVTFHCAGMCGPIIAGVTVSGKSSLQRAQMVGAYQLGRSITYASMGALAGLFGAAFETGLATFTEGAGFVLAAAMILIGITQFRFVARRLPDWASAIAGRTSKIVSRALKTGARASSPLARAFVTGLLLGFLPCMLMFWVLGIAISTGSPLHGAGVMVLLVLMTTPTLMSVSIAAGLGLRKVNKDVIVPWAFLISGIWLGLIAAATQGWIEHVHLPFELFGEKLVIMLW
jgi:sulfite exporter TauE/SafE